jgi:hypothetical protein
MVLGILPMFKEVLSALLTTDDQDILDYVTGTVEQCVDDGDTSAEALTDALSDLLISYELAPDEDAASAICVSLSEQLSGSMPVSSQAEERPKLLSAPVLMGEDRADEAPISLTSRPVNMDALGNSCSMAARANAAAAAAKEGPPSKNVAEAKAEPDAGASGPAFGLLHATSVSKAEQTARDNAELEASRREREAACERYLLSKAAGGSRDVAIKGLILLAPTGKPLIDGGEDGSAKLQLVAGRRYGLVGRNGTGKSTLLKAIASYEISGFPQHLKVEHTLHPAPCTLHSVPTAAVTAILPLSHRDLTPIPTPSPGGTCRARPQTRPGRLAALHGAGLRPRAIPAAAQADGPRREARGGGADGGGGGARREGCGGPARGARAEAVRGGGGVARRTGRRGGRRGQGGLDPRGAAVLERDDECTATHALGRLAHACHPRRRALRSLRRALPLDPSPSTLRPRPSALRPPPRDPETPRPRDTEQILLLDEPTNHLDFPALAWLTRWLRDKCKATLLIVSNPNPDPSPNPRPRPRPSPSPNPNPNQATLLIVSHDRGFLDDVVTDVVQLRGRNLTSFRGDITSYVKNVDEQKREQKRRRAPPPSPIRPRP